MLTPSLEDYLEEMYRSLRESNRTARVSEIANILEVSMPSVVKALKKLEKMGYIIYMPYGEIELTADGKATGEFLVKRNMVLRKFFEMLDLTCDASAEAEAVEHYLTYPIIKALEKWVQFMKERGYVEEFRKFKPSQSCFESKNK
ncbi:MAG: ArsR family transcriptional regulator [Thermoanaerobacterales bacterium]|jgi:DtxR family Mn-dependent transcriptional regulator|nr:ArsR family transcriptional regulator [Thermoanaerobacterales bacterium]